MSKNKNAAGLEKLLHLGSGSIENRYGRSLDHPVATTADQRAVEMAGLLRLERAGPSHTLVVTKIEPTVDGHLCVEVRSRQALVNLALWDQRVATSVAELGDWTAPCVDVQLSTAAAAVTLSYGTGRVEFIHPGDDEPATADELAAAARATLPDGADGSPLLHPITGWHRPLQPGEIGEPETVLAVEPLLSTCSTVLRALLALQDDGRVDVRVWVAMSSSPQLQIEARLHAGPDPNEMERPDVEGTPRPWATWDARDLAVALSCFRMPGVGRGLIHRALHNSFAVHLPTATLRSVPQRTLTAAQVSAAIAALGEGKVSDAGAPDNSALLWHVRTHHLDRNGQPRDEPERAVPSIIWKHGRKGYRIEDLPAWAQPTKSS